MNEVTNLPFHCGSLYCGAYAKQAVSVARSYWKAKQAGIMYHYQAGNTLMEGNPLDERGYCYIDCSTYMGLVLRGISFENSYGIVLENSGNYDLAELLGEETNHYPWTDSNLNGDELVGKQVRTAGDLAKYMYLSGRCFTNPEEVREGDLVFCVARNQDGTYKRKRTFLHVSHIGMIAEADEGEVAFYNATNYPGVVLRTRLSRREDVAFFARPCYEKSIEMPEFDETFNLLTPPWLDKRKSFGNNDVTMKKDGTICIDLKDLKQGAMKVDLQRFWLEAGRYCLYTNVEYLSYDTKSDILGGGLTIKSCDTKRVLARYRTETKSKKIIFSVENKVEVNVYIHLGMKNQSIWKPELVRIG
ncbi:MAG: hypothetical protein ACI4C1_07810 [Lachnospiraceae bacterium]